MGLYLLVRWRYVSLARLNASSSTKEVCLVFLYDEISSFSPATTFVHRAFFDYVSAPKEQAFRLTIHTTVSYICRFISPDYGTACVEDHKLVTDLESFLNSCRHALHHTVPV